MNVVDRSVLVLNSDWRPVQITDVARAVCLLVAGRAWGANHLDAEDWTRHDWDSWSALSVRSAQATPSGQRLRTASRSYLAPEVIGLVDYARTPVWRQACNAGNIRRRDRHQCQYCGRTFPPSLLTLDHVIPRSQGGRNGWENLVAACVVCNQAKGGRTPQQAGMRLLRPPRRPAAEPPWETQPLASWSRFLPS